MGGLNVKNTIVEVVLQNIAPHPCSGCGKIGSLLCDYCKYDIVSEPFLGCVLCGTANLNGICENHNENIRNAFVVHTRKGVVKRLIDELKFQRVKSAAKSLALLLHESLPELPSDTIIVPIPTVKSHVRQRGYDQVKLIAKHLAQLRSLPFSPLLVRANSATQHELNKRERAKESRQAFKLSSSFTHNDKNHHCLLLDDIITTGSTISSAAKLLSRQGFTVIVGALAYQPLD